MSQLLLRDEAKSIILELNIQFQSCKGNTYDDATLQDNLNRILRFLDHIQKENNNFLIELDRFYQSTSFLIGMGNIHLNEQANKVWRDYDHFCFGKIKPQLKIYSNAPVF